MRLGLEVGQLAAAAVLAGRAVGALAAAASHDWIQQLALAVRCRYRFVIE
jgi:hypothetical protein